MRSRVLVVDDDVNMCDLLETALGKAGFEVVCRTSADEALTALRDADFDAVVTDLNMRGMNGLELCERIRANRPGAPVIVITAFGSLETAIAAIRAGAYDFVTKPFDTEELELSLNRAVQYRRLEQEVKRLRAEVGSAARFHGLLGESRAMQAVYDLIGRIADAEASVLISGETGTGKELVARALHQASRRSHRPFVAINCAAVPETLLESELFGHVKGAFTDARTARKGLLAEADGGSVFLDEIGSMPLAVQAKLLRTLQERTVRPVGGNTEQPIDVRVLVATNCDLEAAVEEGVFREDLLFRINVIHLALPPLRTRGNDVLLLAQHFVRQFAERSGRPVAGVSTPAAEKLLNYSWPGNVRELQNCMERAVALTNHEQLTVEDLPEKIRSCGRPQPLVLGDDPTELLPMDEVERRYIARVLEAVGGNKTLAAQVLGFDRRTLYRKLKHYHLGTGPEPHPTC